MTKTNTRFAFLVLALLISACQKDESPAWLYRPDPVTSVEMRFIPVNNADTTVVFFAEDITGEWDNLSFDTYPSLDTNATYTFVISAFGSENNSRNYSVPGTMHQYFLEDSACDWSFEFENDVNGNPIGSLGQVFTGGPSSGTLKIIHRFEPDKFAEGVSEGDITNAGGETDFELTFNVTIE